jgi:Uma2 family endonuclease
MAQVDLKPLTFEQFMDWERGQELKHEFVDGQAVAMAGGTEAHNIIQANLIAAAAPRLRGSGCRPLTSDLLIRTGTERGRYPDMTIDCGPRRGENLLAPEPRVVFEVLSEDTQRRDRTIKLADYNATPSIAHYVLVEQAALLVHVYSRGPHGDFNLRPQEVRGWDGVVALPAIGLSLPMSEIYDDLELDVATDSLDADPRFGGADV